MSQDASKRQGLQNPPLDGSALDASTDRSTLDRPTAAVSSLVVAEAGDLFVESYADRLMNDLFSDVEHMLDGLVKAPPKPSTSQDQTATSSSLIASDAAITSQEPQAQSLSRDAETETLATLATPTVIYQSSQSYDRLLLGIGCISIIVTLAIWLLSQEARRAPLPVTASLPAPVVNPVSPAESQFADYIQRSLQTIDQTAPTSGTATVLPSTMTVNPGLPTVSVPGSPTIPGTPTISAPTTALQNRAPAGLAKIYSPVYQLPPGATTSGIPSLPGNAATVKRPIPLSVPGVARTLVGVVELGDRSAVLIDINGVTQRFRLGESIGSSGWMLVEVSKNQAIVRRNGEVRSVFVGQSF